MYTYGLSIYTFKKLINAELKSLGGLKLSNICRAEN